MRLIIYKIIVNLPVGISFISFHSHRDIFHLCRNKMMQCHAKRWEILLSICSNEFSVNMSYTYTHTHGEKESKSTKSEEENSIYHCVFKCRCRRRWIHLLCCLVRFPFAFWIRFAIWSRTKYWICYIIINDTVRVCECWRMYAVGIIEWYRNGRVSNGSWWCRRPLFSRFSIQQYFTIPKAQLKSLYTWKFKHEKLVKAKTEHFRWQTDEPNKTWKRQVNEENRNNTKC